MTRMLAPFVAVVVWLLPLAAKAFVLKPPTLTYRASPLYSIPSLEEAAELKAQAEKIRLEAEKMDAQLTLEKIASLEQKLNDKAWLTKHPDQEAELMDKLQELNDKLQGKKTPTKKVSTSRDTEKESSPAKKTAWKKSVKDFPLSGFDPEDLELYIPIALEIQANMTNATTAEQLTAFQQSPKFQEHCSAKIQSLLVDPMQNLQKLEKLKSNYLSSRSSLEKQQLKREIEQLERSVEKESPFIGSKSVYVELPELTEEEVQQRVDAIQELPPLLQLLYKRRNDVDEDGDLVLAIQLEHFEPQINLLNQVEYVAPLSEEHRKEAIRGYESLPRAVQEFFLKKLELDPGVDAATVVQTLEAGASEQLKLLGLDDVVVEVSTSPDLPEYSDIDFLDRSRFVEEFFPAIARMEETKPTEEEIETFCSDVLEKKTYTLTDKPERVLGGYFLRGINRIEEHEEENANNLLVERLNEKLQSVPSLKDDLQFFFVPDPMPLTDEEIELETTHRPLLVVTSKNLPRFYSTNSIQLKLLVSSLGILSTIVFAVGACGMNSATVDRLQQAMDSGSNDISFLTTMVASTALSILGIQLVHEAAHRLVAWKDKFDIGLPNLVPSIALGITGAITPLKSPPKNWNSLFDFSIAGPLAGMVASIALLCDGLGITASMDDLSQLPALPVSLLHASALGGGLVEAFLGSGVLTMSASPETAVLALHPFAIAGYVGLIINALSLLPLGHTDGGRVALAMFGRRGTFLVKTFSILALCIVGLFGFDNSQILLLHALFVVIWQRELETPMLNEVDDLETSRGLVGIATAVLVALTLIPFV